VDLRRLRRRIQLIAVAIAVAIAIAIAVSCAILILHCTRRGLRKLQNEMHNISNLGAAAAELGKAIIKL